MSMRRATWRVRWVVLLAAGLLACGGEDVCLQCPEGTPTPGQSGAIVTGQIVNTNPFTSPATINVVICVGLEPGQGVENCPNTFLTLANTQGDFTRNNVLAGSETVYFWVDADQNGMIDPDDPLAQLGDPQGALSSVRSGQTVTLANVRISFVDDTATAEISVTNSPTPTPSTAQPTPTPSPLS